MKDHQNTPASDGLAIVRKNIIAVLEGAGRDKNAAQLVAVSKTFDGKAIKPVLEAGQRVFGENRVQETAGKWPDLQAQYEGVKLHLIGPLQTNKVAVAVALFDVIETLDRPKLAKFVAREMAKQSKTLELFVQVNTGAEPQKAGVLPQDLGGFLSYCRQELDLGISGLMCIPPQNEDARFHFTMLADLAAKNDVKNLSMGMSADYGEAIKCGATHVRVGSAIFGHR
jgi:pyridoxal phosphate enzyme (YggS family)